MTQFQYYSGNIKKSRPIGWVTIDQFIHANKHPKPHILDLFNQIAHYESIGDMEMKSKLKERLFSFTPCVHISQYRRYSDILSFTGLLVLDFDHIHNAPEFKEHLFNEYKFIMTAWLSPSKRGVKALVNIPIVNTIDDFKSLYYGISQEMWQFNGFDGTGQNCVLPLFQSYDPELLHRSDYDVWIEEGQKLNDFSATPTEPTPIDPKDRNESRIIKMIDSGLDKITDNGHPQLRSVCLAVGGYIVNGYIDKLTALQHIDNRITSHAYLKKGIEGYKKTARWGVEMGMTKPLHL